MWEKVKLFFGAVGDFLKPIAKIFSTKAGNILKDVALDVVLQIAADPSLVKKGGLAKRQAAFEKIKAELKRRGLEELKTSVVNMAIEAAYQKAVDDGKIEEE